MKKRLLLPTVLLAWLVLFCPKLAAMPLAAPRPGASPAPAQPVAALPEQPQPTPAATLTVHETVVGAAYAQLDEAQQALVDTENATVSIVVLREWMGTGLDRACLGERVYLVDFPAGGADGAPENLVVYLDMQEKSLAGYGYID